jgi:release factor glutamine methyltransferase
MQIAKLLEHATNAIQAQLPLHQQDASLEARYLLQHQLQVDRAWLIAHASDDILKQDDDAFHALLNRRLNGEPIAYILGEREFYGLNLKVTPDTLIPRPDTETLVDATLKKIEPHLPLSICDLGTGTGAIALAIAKHRPHMEVTAVDASESALKIAQENAEHLDITNIIFVQSNWFAELNNKTFDFIVSNPPYIEENDPHLSQGDLRFEPRTALASGSDGLDDIRHIINHATNHLKTKGWLMLEHGFNQAKAVAQLLSLAGFKNIEHVDDLAEIQRVTIGQWF